MSTRLLARNGYVYNSAKQEDAFQGVEEGNQTEDVVELNINIKSEEK